MTIKRCTALLLSTVVVFGILTSCGADVAAEENGVLPIESEIGSVSTPHEGNGTVDIEVTPVEDKQALELYIPRESYSLHSEVIPYAIVNNTGKHAEVLLIPNLEKETDNGWETLAPEGVGFCGVADPVDTQRDGELPLAWYANSLTAGCYRLSFDVVESNPKIETVSAVFELDDSDLLPYEIGSLTVMAGGIEYEPYIHFLYAASLTEHGTLFADGIPIDVERIAGELPLIQYGEDFSFVLEGKDASATGYSLYDGNFECLYFLEEEFSLPAAAGEYLLGVDIKWQAANDDAQNPQYTGYRYFFKIIVS